MAAKKKAARKVRTLRSDVKRAATRLSRTWDDTREAIGTAEATVGKKVRALVKKSGLDTRAASDKLSAWKGRVERERRRAVKKLEAEMVKLQSRAKKERRAIGRMVDDAVKGALAALNIPSRNEVHELTRRVEELSRKIDGFRRTPRAARTAARPATNA
jgi:hypothetical protein